MARGRYISNAHELLPDQPLELPVELPPHPQGREWSPHAQRIWEGLRHNVARYAWTDGDLHALASLVLLEDTLAVEGVTAALASELRRMRDTLGLTPQARLRLGLPATDAEAAKRVSNRGRQSVSGADELSVRRLEIELRLDPDNDELRERLELARRSHEARKRLDGTTGEVAP